MENSSTPQTSSWKLGHAVISIIHIVWLTIQLIFHFGMMIGYYNNSIPGFATADLIIILICFFLLFASIAGLIVMFVPPTRIPPLIGDRMLKFNTMAYVLGMQYFTFLYFLLWVTELAHTPLLLNLGGFNGFVISSVIAFVHPGITIIPFVIQFIIGIISAFTSVNYYLFTERIRVGKILGPYQKKSGEQSNNTTTVIIQQPMMMQQNQHPMVYTPQPANNYSQMQQQPVTMVQPQYHPQGEYQQQPTTQMYQQPMGYDVKMETNNHPELAVHQQPIEVVQQTPMQSYAPPVDEGMVDVNVQHM